ncbi:MAG TPA: hypothetical protein VFZ69_15675 [Longimicrobiales bacterium]
MTNSEPSTFLTRLKRRKIAQWTIAYLSAAWLILQVVNVIADQFGWPGALERGITLILVAGLFATLTLAWFHGEQGHQRITRLELVLLVGILVGAGFMIRAVGGGAAEAVAPGDSVAGRDPQAVALMPFVPASPDSLLERLGRDLVVTIGATLDGIQGIRVIDPLTLLAQTSRDSVPITLDRGIALANRLGAGRLLHGTLARSGSTVRLDASLYDIDGTRALARVTVEQPVAAISTITDSVVFSLVRQLWRGSSPDVPSPAALATSSVEALRAYLDGEHALAAAEMPRALASFERAFALDSTYWFAYWRSLYPRVYEGTLADSAAVARVVAHRDELPPADRLLVEVGTLSSARAQLRMLESGARRFATHWPTWYTYANLLVHWGSYLGTSYDDSRTALERVIELNPQFSPAWEHLFWIAAHQRDTAATEQALARMAAFSGPDSYRFNEDALMLYRTISHLVSNNGRFEAGELASTTDYVATYRGPIPPAAFGVGLLVYGLPHAQQQIADAVLARDAAGELATGMWHGSALSLAGRGDWQAAAHAADLWAAASESSAAALSAYGLLATGTALGVFPADSAARRRPDARVRFTEPEMLAELAWSDGLVAFSRGDASALRDSRNRVAASGSAYSALLDGSLRALQTSLDGDPARAALILVRIEEESADRFLQSGYRWTHPYITSVNRLLAGRWLLESGDAVATARLLRFMEAVLPGAPPLETVNRTIGGLGYYYRARAEEEMGRLPEARLHYHRFLDQLDRPAPELAPLVTDARERLARIAVRP